MVERISIEDYISNYADIPIIDVRTPGEFDKGHIPWANNIPLFSNDERARVGTVYKQQSKEEAIALGYEFVKPKLEWFVSQAIKINQKNVVAVHCWRGGMRSHAFAEHLSDNGFVKVFVIEKGYKAFRNYVLRFFEQPFRLNVLGGYTGSGKTDILMQLKLKGEQVIDLEGLANHKGSAFGGIGQNAQPAVEHFENLLFNELNKLINSKPIWIEDESLNIGKVIIPKAFFNQIRESKVYFIEIPQPERAKFLLTTYGMQNKTDLKESIMKISKRLGPLNTKLAIEALENNNLQKVAELSLMYYDKAYAKGLSMRDKSEKVKIEFDTVDASYNTTKLLQRV